MAALAPASDQGADLLQKLSLENKKDDGVVVDATKKPSALPYGSANSSDAQGAAFQADRSITPLLQEAMDPNLFYQSNGYASPAYYYNGYDGSVNEWDSRYANREGLEMSQNVYGDMYHHGYGYAPYGPYPSGSPVPTVGHDGQLYGTQQYQYSAPYYQPQTPISVAHGPSGPASQAELSTSVTVNQAHVPANAAKASSNGIANAMANGNGGSTSLKQTHQNASVTSNSAYGRGPLQGGLTASSFGYNGLRSPPVQWYDGPLYSNGHQRPAASSISPSVSYGANNLSRNQNQRPSANLMGIHQQRPLTGMGPTSPSYLNRMYPNNRFYGQYGQYGSVPKVGLGFESNAYNSRNSGRWGIVDTKYKPRGRGTVPFGFGNVNQDGFTELNRGPRSGGLKNQKPFGPTVTIAVKGQALPCIGKQDTGILPDKEQFNREDFPVTHTEAKFFIIKSYSEDDVHKSIKYNVWASTPNGNKKLDAGYREAQEKTNKCPVFLFFSVNTSGQFVGVAEMVGPVDFDKTVEYWQQDKWNGCFPLKWHFVKDVPNSILKHITLDNNENKPVTNSRDTQEVKLEQGLEMLRIFKDYVSKTSILDDFGFYENRQKLMQEKRAKQQQHLQSQVWDEMTDAVSGEKDRDQLNGKPRVQKASEPVSTLSKEAAPFAGESLQATKASIGNGLENGN